MSFLVKHLGIAEYESTYQAMRDFTQRRDSDTLDEIWILEHPPVFTLGLAGDASNLHSPSNHIPLVQVDRGGEITYHGPGQLVGYPIFDLDFFFNDIHKYLRFLEEAIILTCADYGLTAGRIPGLTGVWLDIEDPIKARKICAFGVRCSRWVTMHGFAFNINADLSYFNMIVPCGITDKGVTSLQKELGREVDLEEVKAKVLLHMQELFNFSIQTPPNETLPWMENDSIKSA
jgi:lipoyl(octanoyl) transferase